MISTKGYFDLCVSEKCLTQGNVEKNLKIYYDFGYRTLAINQYVNEETAEQTKKKKRRGEPREDLDVVPCPCDLTKFEKIAEKLDFKNFKILNRLTIIFSHKDGLNKIVKSTNYKKYHLIAASPETLEAFNFTCHTLEADIFSFNPENKFAFKMSRKLYYKLCERGYHFEILYSPAIEDSTKRKNTIHASHLYHSYGKSRNIIISSGASLSLYIRNPYDVINLGLIFGLSTQQCKNALFHCPNQVVINSVGRRHGKAVMFVENIADPVQEQSDSVIVLNDSEDEDMEIDEPVHKKSKQ